MCDALTNRVRKYSPTHKPFTSDNSKISGKLSKVAHRASISESRDTVTMRFVNAQGSTAQGIDEQNGTVNYFIGKDPKKWFSNIHTYSRVRYRDVYPGVDQVFYGTGQRL